MASRARRTVKATPEPPKPVEEEPVVSSEEEEAPAPAKKGRAKKESAKAGRVFRLDQSSLVCEQGPDVTQMDVKDLFTSEYVYPNPASAAKKAFAKVCRLFTPVTKKGEERKTIDLVVYTLTVVEVSNGKRYSYRATRAARTADDILKAEEKRKEKGDDSKPFIQAIYKTTVKAHGVKTPVAASSTTPAPQPEPEVVAAPTPAKVVAKKTVPATKKATTTAAVSPKIIEHPPVVAETPQPKKATTTAARGKAPARGGKAK